MEGHTRTQNTDLAGRIGLLRRNDTHEILTMFAGNSTPVQSLRDSGYLSSKLRKQQAGRLMRTGICSPIIYLL